MIKAFLVPVGFLILNISPCSLQASSLSTMTPEQRLFYEAVVVKFAPRIMQDFRVIEVDYEDASGEQRTAKILDPADAPTAHDFDGDWDLSNNHKAFFETDEDGNLVYPITLKNVQDINEKGWVRVPALMDGVIVEETATQIYLGLPLYHMVDTASFLSFVKEHSQDGSSIWMVLDKKEDYSDEAEIDVKLTELSWAYSLTDPHGLARPVSPDPQLEDALREKILAALKPKDKRNLQGSLHTLDRGARAHLESENPTRFIRDPYTNEITSFYVFSARQSHALFQGDVEAFQGSTHVGHVYMCDGEWQEGEELPMTYCSVVDPETGEVSMPLRVDRITPLPFRFRADILNQAFPLEGEPSLDVSQAYVGGLDDVRVIQFSNAEGSFVLRDDLPAHFAPGKGDEKAKANLPENLFPNRPYAKDAVQVSIFHLVDSWLRPDLAEAGGISDVYLHNPFIQKISEAE